MANQQGFSVEGGAASLSKLFAHFDRTKMRGEDGEYYEPYRWLTQRGYGSSYNQSEVDPSRTHLNYNLAADDQPMAQAAFVEKRLGEVWCHKSALVNGVVDWVVTLPDMGQYGGREREFFEACYSAMRGKYGRENVVSAYVHMDEAQPHMHFAFVPVADDPKHAQGLKLSRKAVNTCDRVDKKGKPKRDTREYSRQFHSWLDGEVCRAMGLSEAGVVLTDEQRESRKIKENMDGPAELRRAMEQLEAAERDKAALLEEIACRDGRLHEAREALADAEAELSAIRAEASEARREASEAREEAARAQREAEEAKGALERLSGRFNELLRQIMEVVDTLSQRPFLLSWKKSLEALRDNPIARRAAEEGQPWRREKDAARAERSVRSDVRGAISALDEMAAEARESARAYNRDRRDGGSRGGDAR